ncbi:hypothetical protein O6H91_21G028700 [Diphasiastrum complanatum]|uniref:Uncharacterized protein n=1 Tax=Diphasiastrum complanatum TaxID=34168 RepID=A0ACC2AJ22_DIPCM|nr:hypothetical protein O6H91_21G028700 [Diphasiastrum complanatum]
MEQKDQAFSFAKKMRWTYCKVQGPASELHFFQYESLAVMTVAFIDEFFILKEGAATVGSDGFVKQRWPFLFIHKSEKFFSSCELNDCFEMRSIVANSCLSTMLRI